MSISIDHSIISEIAENAGNVEVIPDYSGRGMFGERCLAITGTVSNLASFVAQTVLRWQEAVEFDGNDQEALQRLAEEIEDPSQDSLGMESVFYWPRIQVTNIIEVTGSEYDWEDDEDEDEDEEVFSHTERVYFEPQTGAQYAASERDREYDLRP